MRLSTHTVCFGPFQLDLRVAELRLNGSRTRLPDQPFQVLTALLEKPGEVVTREELRQRLWGSDTFVDFEHSLNAAVKRLREILGDSAENPRYIETLPRHGYRLIVPVENLEPPASAIPETSKPRRRIWLAVVSAIFVFVVLVAYLLWHRFRVHAHPRARLILAVLPLENLSGDPDQEYLADSLTEDIITELGRLSPTQLGVIARTSVTQFSRTRKPISEIGKQLRADYIVEGSTRKSGQQLRVTLQLIRVSDQTHLWAEAYDSNLADLSTVERTVAEKTARTLSLELVPAVQQRLASGPVISGEAQEAYLRGRFLLARRTGSAFEQARNYFQKAIELEPRYAEAYSGLAVALMLLPNYQAITVNEAIPRAKEAAQKALQLDPSITEARTVLAQIHSEFEWDFARAEREFQQVLQDGPNDARAHSGYAALLWAMGRFDEAITEMKKVSELAPLSLGAGVDMGRAYYFARRYDLAIQQYERVIELEPNYPAAHSMLGMALLEKHDDDRAIAELKKGMALSDGQSIWLAYAYAVAGRKADAQQELSACLERWNSKHTGATCMALAYLGLGDKDQAFAWLEKDFQGHTGTIFMLKAFPYWDSLRSDPRFQDLLRRMNFPSK
jgi:TolB-like protein/DNA-binding winged helix-turn-helix (wHTH) protein/Flp pilus assembly protein TadD